MDKKPKICLWGTSCPLNCPRSPGIYTVPKKSQPTWNGSCPCWTLRVRVSLIKGLLKFSPLSPCLPHVSLYLKSKKPFSDVVPSFCKKGISLSETVTCPRCGCSFLDPSLGLLFFCSDVRPKGKEIIGDPSLWSSPFNPLRYEKR